MELHEVDYIGVGPSLKSEDLQSIAQTILNMESELALIKAKLNGEQFLRKPKKNPKISAKITNNMFVIMVVWELLYLCSVGVFEILFWNNESVGKNIIYWVSCLFGFSFQSIAFVFLIVCSVKLAKQINHHTASIWFLIQSFLCYVLFFASIYTVLCKTFDSAFETVDNTQEIFLLFNTFVYFSSTTIATVGFGDVTPTAWYSEILVTAESLLSVVFTTVIFAMGLTRISGRAIPTTPN